MSLTTWLEEPDLRYCRHIVRMSVIYDQILHLNIFIISEYRNSVVNSISYYYINHITVLCVQELQPVCCNPWTERTVWYRFCIVLAVLLHPKYL
jgi:hypothetical protein